MEFPRGRYTITSGTELMAPHALELIARSAKVLVSRTSRLGTMEIGAEMERETV